MSTYLSAWEIELRGKQHAEAAEDAIKTGGPGIHLGVAHAALAVYYELRRAAPAAGDGSL